MRRSVRIYGGIRRDRYHAGPARSYGDSTGGGGPCVPFRYCTRPVKRGTAAAIRPRTAATRLFQTMASIAQCARDPGMLGRCRIMTARSTSVPWHRCRRLADVAAEASRSPTAAGRCQNHASALPLDMLYFLSLPVCVPVRRSFGWFPHTHEFDRYTPPCRPPPRGLGASTSWIPDARPYYCTR